MVSLLSGSAWLSLGAVLRVQAQRTVERLTLCYGDGCVARIDGVFHAGKLRCRIGGLDIGTSYVDNLPPDWSRKLSVNGIVLRPNVARHAQIAVDTFDAAGRPTGTFTSGALFSHTPLFGQPTKVFGPPLRQRFPFVLAVRTVQTFKPNP